GIAPEYELAQGSVANVDLGKALMARIEVEEKIVADAEPLDLARARVADAQAGKETDGLGGDLEPVEVRWAQLGLVLDRDASGHVVVDLLPPCAQELGRDLARAQRLEQVARLDANRVIHVASRHQQLRVHDRGLVCVRVASCQSVKRRQN